MRVQAALVKCYVSWGRVQRADDPDAYVYRILTNTIRSARRRRGGSEYPSASTSDAVWQTDEFGRAEDATAIERALAGLSAPARQVVVLRYYADLSERQTASVLKIPAGTVKSRLARALAQLAADKNLADLRLDRSTP